MAFYRLPSVISRRGGTWLGRLLLCGQLRQAVVVADGGPVVPVRLREKSDYALGLYFEESHSKSFSRRSVGRLPAGFDYDFGLYFGLYFLA